MPLFMDVHERLPEGTNAMDLEELHRKDVEVQQRRGVRYRRYWLDEGARKLFCLVEAPSAEAAVAVHREAHGLLADRIYQVQEGHLVQSKKGGRDMTQPFIFVGTHKIKEGKLEEYKKQLQELVEVVETNEPRLIAFNIYLDEDANRISGVQVHPDAASMEFHMKVVGEHIRDSYDYIEKTESIDVFGEPTDALLVMLRQAAPSGTPLRVMPLHEAGFTRTTAS